jgi:hypothetical protein
MGYRAKLSIYAEIIGATGYLPLYSAIFVDFMVKLDRLANVIIRVNLFVIAALSAALFTPFSLNINPLVYVCLTFSLIIFCVIALFAAISKRNRTDRNPITVDRLTGGIAISIASLIYSMITTILLPLFSPLMVMFIPSLLFHPVFMAQFLFQSSPQNSVRFIASPSGRKSVKLVCFSDGFLSRSTGGYLYKEWFLIQHKIARLELPDSGENCPTDDSQKFTWSDDESYLNWQEYNRGDQSTVKKKVRVY